MRATEKDTEITLGTGWMLTLFFAIVVVCAGFFAIGFSLGRKSSLLGINSAPGSSGEPASIVVGASGNNSGANRAVSTGQGSSDEPAEPASAPSPTASPADQSAANHPSASAAAAPSATGGYFVQVAAVTREEDADALVEALKKKQYSAFSAKNSSADKFYHVQVGPYSEFKEAEAMRNRLISDGYNPILKKQ
jgi:DedD protein